MIEEDVDEGEEAVVDLMHNLTLRNPQHTQYLGRSSSLALVRTAMALREEYTEPDGAASSSGPPGAHEAKVHTRTPEFWDDTPVSDISFLRYYSSEDMSTVAADWPRDAVPT